MGNPSMYENSRVQQRVLQQYEEYVQLFTCKVEREYIQTRFGKTHVLKLGKSDGKPLFIFHGANCINPMTLSWFEELFADYRIYAPDTIGHPGFSAEVRIDPEGNSFALWVKDLLDHYGIDSCAFAGVSYGGGILLRLAAAYPEKINCAILVVPAGISAFSKWWTAKKMLLPFLMYQLNDSTKQIKAVTDAMSAGMMKPIDREVVATLFQHVKLERDLPKLATKEELQHYYAPTMIIAGMKDVLFPEKKLFRKAAPLFGDLLEWRAYHMGHFPSRTAIKRMNEDMAAFLLEHY